MSRVIVTTTIHGMTPALEAFAAMPGWDLIVVTDRKTPPVDPPGVTVLSPADQERLDPALSDLIGWDCVQRRNLGYLLAYRWGAEIVATVDDDNIPLPGWGEGVCVGRPVEARCYTGRAARWFDPLAVTRHPHLWHRGFPLTALADRQYDDAGAETVVPAVEASLWLGDPDVDAVCRLEHRPWVDDWGAPFPVTSRHWGPFNSQNTFLSRTALRDYFCPPGIGRFDDIWAGFHVQAQGHRVVWSAPTVRQERNDHDLLDDLDRETWGMLRTPGMLAGLAIDPGAMARHLPERSRRAFAAHRAHVAAVDAGG